MKDDHARIHLYLTEEFVHYITILGNNKVI